MERAILMSSPLTVRTGVVLRCFLVVLVPAAMLAQKMPGLAAAPAQAVLAATLATSSPGRRLEEARGPETRGPPVWPTGRPTRRRTSPSGRGARSA